MFTRFIEIISIPIIFLNFGSGIVGGVWLAFLGEWRLVGIGVALLFTASFSLSILMLPSIPIGMIATYFLNRRKRWTTYLGQYFLIHRCEGFMIEIEQVKIVK